MDGVSGPGVGLEATVTHAAAVGMTTLGMAVLLCDAGDAVRPQEVSTSEKTIMTVLSGFFEYGMLWFVNCLLKFLKRCHPGDGVDEVCKRCTLLP